MDSGALPQKRSLGAYYEGFPLWCPLVTEHGVVLKREGAK
jgi:hypothetical protein